MGLRGKAREVESSEESTIYGGEEIENFSCGKLDVWGVARESDSIEMSK